MNKKLAMGGLVAALSIGVVGCGGSGAKDSAHPSGVATHESKTKGATGPAVKITPHPRRILAGIGLARQTHVQHCGTAPGPVTAGGTVTVPASSKATVAQVTISWVKIDNGNQVATATQTVKGVVAGRNSSWHVAATLPKTPGTVKCVLRSVVPKA